MPAERNTFKLGLTLIVFGVLLIGVLVFLAPRAGGDLDFVVRFKATDFATPLKDGGQVVCGGTAVGSIKGLRLLEGQDPDSGASVLYADVDVAVLEVVDLKRDCRIIPEGQLLGGIGQLRITDRGQGQPVQPGDIIMGQPEMDISAITRMLAQQLDPNEPTSLLSIIKGQLNPGDERSLLGKIHKSLDDVNAVTQSIENEFDASQKAALLGQLHSILDQVNLMTTALREETDKLQASAISAKLHHALDTVNRALSSAAMLIEDNREDITSTIKHVRGTSEILERQIAARIAEQLDPKAAASLIVKVHAAVDKLDASLSDINTVTDAGQEIVSLNREQISRMVGNLKETSEQLKAASKEIRRSPWRLFYTPSPEELAQANVFDAARAFAEAASKLDDTVVRLQTISSTDPEAIANQQQKLSETRQQLQQTISDFQKAENALWKELKVR